MGVHIKIEVRSLDSKIDSRGAKMVRPSSSPIPPVHSLGLHVHATNLLGAGGNCGGMITQTFARQIYQSDDLSIQAATFLLYYYSCLRLVAIDAG